VVPEMRYQNTFSPTWKIRVLTNFFRPSVYADKWVESYKKSGIPYLLSGMMSMHVNYAIEVIEKHDNVSIRKCI